MLLIVLGSPMKLNRIFACSKCEIFEVLMAASSVSGGGPR